MATCLAMVNKSTVKISVRAVTCSNDRCNFQLYPKRKTKQCSTSSNSCERKKAALHDTEVGMLHVQSVCNFSCNVIGHKLPGNYIV